MNILSHEVKKLWDRYIFVKLYDINRDVRKNERHSMERGDL